MSSTGLAISGAFLAVLIGASLTPVHGQEIGDRREGLALAQQVCSECHVIGRGQVGPPELTGTDILRACHRSRYDGRCLNGGAYHAPCGDANVHVYGRPKTRCNRLHPQPTLSNLKSG